MPIFVLDRLTLVHSQQPASDISAIECVDGLLGFHVIWHLHKPEASRSAGFPVCDHLGALHVAMPLKQRQQAERRSAKRRRTFGGLVLTTVLVSSLIPNGRANSKYRVNEAGADVAIS